MANKYLSWDSEHPGTDGLKAIVLVILNIMEVSINEEAVMSELMVVLNMVFILNVLNVGVKVDQLDVSQVHQVHQFKLLDSTGRVGQTLQVVNVTSDLVALEGVVVSFHVVVGLLVGEIHSLVVVQVVSTAGVVGIVHSCGVASHID